MSRSDKEHKEAEVAARRARRLADRAEQRAQRKGEQAKRAAERADKLAERAKRRSPRDREIDSSIEDYVDDVADKWSRKAEDWIDRNAKNLFDGSTSDKYSDRESYSHTENDSEDHYDEGSYGEGHSDDKHSKSRRRKDARGMNRDRGGSNAAATEAQRLAEKARQTADAAERLARATANGDLDSKRSRRSRRRSKSRGSRMERESSFSSWKRKSWKRRGYGFYYDDKNKKICGVCAGTAEYLGVETWQVRLAAVLGLIFAGSFMVPAYFITYFLMDKKPYYREANDRYEAEHDMHEEMPSMRKRKSSQDKADARGPLPTGSLKVAKKKFMDIEARLRSMETHVTSSRFELQREIKKISGED